MNKPKYSVSESSIGGGVSVGALAGAGGAGAGVGGKSLLTLAGVSFRVSLCSFFASRVLSGLWFLFFPLFDPQVLVEERTSSVISLASGDFHVFILNTLFAISRVSIFVPGYRY
jgi:hypothetical protein